MKSSRLKEHLTKVHPERSREHVVYFRKLHDKIMNRRTLCSNFTDDCKVWQTTHNRGAVVGSSDIGRKTSLSKDTAQRRTDEMAMDVEEALCDLLRRTEFPLQLEESTQPGNEALLLAYVHFIKDQQLTQEFLFARELSTDAKEHNCRCYCATGLNDALEMHQYPLPTPEDVFTTLNGGTVFSQIDFSDAYLKVEVISIQSPSFWRKISPRIFQQIMDTLISGLRGAVAYLEDVIVVGKTEENHKRNLDALRRI
uniref:Reverse transcriptase domain-containing protein n=1 Tax=Trichuris muris TaxID=70415 RepID=A0A5S6QHW2_TRIMR